MMMSQATLNLLILMIFSFIGTGCKAAGASSGGDHFNGDPAGKFVTLKETEKSDTGFYTKGCKVQGKADPVYQVDSDLRPGMNFTNFSAMKNATKSYFMSYSESIQTVGTNFISSKIKISDAAGMGGIKKGMEFTNTCKFGLGGSEDCKLVPEPQTVNLSQECKIVDVISIEAQKYYQGQFQFKNNAAVVSSQKDTTRYKVNLNCPFYKGQGWVEVANIKTNQIPSTSSTFCGGTTLYSYYAIKKSDESLLNIAVTELLNFSN